MCGRSRRASCTSEIAFRMDPISVFNSLMDAVFSYASTGALHMQFGIVCPVRLHHKQMLTY